MKNKLIFLLAGLGVLAGIAGALFYGHRHPPEPPVFSPTANPYAKGIYANGIIESYQSNGENINLYPEVAGTVKRILVKEGETVKQGTPLLELDDSVPRATAEQQKSQAEAAQAVLQELKAQPRKETLEVSRAQLQSAHANLKTVQDQLDKQMRSYRLNRKSVSKDVLDNAINAVKVAKANLLVAQKQYDLTRAGAWIYDIRNQEKQADALLKSYLASSALLAKYTLRSPIDGTILSIKAAPGGYASPQGAYSTYTQGLNPVLVMGSSENYLEVRTYVDEILVHRLPDVAQAGSQLNAKMFVRGTSISFPLEFVRVQPYVTPKIELSDQRLERVDVRVLPVIFRFEKPKDVNLYPGQLVDVYVEEKAPPHHLGGIVPEPSPKAGP